MKKYFINGYGFSPLNILIHKETGLEYNMWVAQCLEIDIAAQGHKVEECKQNLIKLLDSFVILAKKKEEQLFKGIQKCPKKYSDMFYGKPGIARELKKSHNFS